MQEDFYKFFTTKGIINIMPENLQIIMKPNINLNKSANQSVKRINKSISTKNITDVDSKP